jgi:hypothetical protein
MEIMKLSSEIWLN